MPQGKLFLIPNVLAENTARWVISPQVQDVIAHTRIFLIENLSVIMQVGYFKYTKRKYGEGRRVFKMSPLHHHYQKLGYSEPKIVTRFWIIGILLAVITIVTLKLR